MPVLLLTEDDVRQLLTMEMALEAESLATRTRGAGALTWASVRECH